MLSACRQDIVGLKQKSRKMWEISKLSAVLLLRAVSLSFGTFCISSLEFANSRTRKVLYSSLSHLRWEEFLEMSLFRQYLSSLSLFCKRQVLFFFAISGLIIAIGLITAFVCWLRGQSFSPFLQHLKLSSWRLCVLEHVALIACLCALILQIFHLAPLFHRNMTIFGFVTFVAFFEVYLVWVVVDVILILWMDNRDEVDRYWQRICW